MCPIRRNSLLVHVAYPQILGTNGLIVVVVVVVVVVVLKSEKLCNDTYFGWEESRKVNK